MMDYNTVGTPGGASYGAPLIDFGRLLNPQQQQQQRPQQKPAQPNPPQQNPQANSTPAQPSQGQGLGSLLQSIFNPTPNQQGAAMLKSPMGTGPVVGPSSTVQGDPLTGGLY